MVWTAEEMLDRLKEKCLFVWSKYKDNPGDYYQEKYDRVMAITHTEDAYILVNMFDIFNQLELYVNLDSDEKIYYHELFEPMLKWASDFRSEHEEEF